MTTWLRVQNFSARCHAWFYAADTLALSSMDHKW